MNTNYQILVASNSLHFLKFKRALRKLHIPFTVVNVHTNNGKRKAFRVSSATHVFLETLQLIQPN